jgi:hypothetical protein
VVCPPSLPLYKKEMKEKKKTKKRKEEEVFEGSFNIAVVTLPPSLHIRKK